MTSTMPDPDRAPVEASGATATPMDSHELALLLTSPLPAPIAAAYKVTNTNGDHLGYIATVQTAPDEQQQYTISPNGASTWCGTTSGDDYTLPAAITRTYAIALLAQIADLRQKLGTAAEDE